MPLYCQEEFEDTKGVIRSCKSKENRQYNGQKKKYKLTNDDLQNTTQTSKGSATVPLKPWGELRHSRRVSSSCSTSDTCCVTVVTNPVIIWYVTNEGRTGLWLRHTEHITWSCVTQIFSNGTEHIRGHVWHRYSVTANQVMVATVKLSKWWLQLNHFSSFLVNSKPLSRKSW